jgi:hypothetical protein
LLKALEPIAIPTSVPSHSVSGDVRIFYSHRPFLNCPPIENWNYHLFDLAGIIRNKMWLFVWLRTLEYVYYEDEPGRRALVRIHQAR